MEEDVEFRRSLPQKWLNYMGVAVSDEVSSIVFFVQNEDTL